MENQEEEITAHQVIQRFADRAGVDFNEGLNILREYDKKLKTINDRPKLIENPDWSDVIKMGESIVNNAIKGYENDDDSQYMLESVMQTLYGKKFYDWYNKVV